MNRLLHTLLIFALLVAGTLVASAGETEDNLLLYRSYLQFLLTSQVQSQVQQLPAGAYADEVSQAAKRWGGQQKSAIKSRLEARWGDEARDKLAEFIDQYKQAEASKDASFLATLCDGRVPPLQQDGYPWLLNVMYAGPLSDTVTDGSDFLAEIQTWLDLKSKEETAVPLEAWLQRDQQTFAWMPPRKVVRVGKPVNPLRAAEAESAPFDDTDFEVVSPMSDYASQRDAKRKKALEEARTGMTQVAAERKAVEEELAKQELAAARVEAEAVQRQARRLAATEKEALDQRKNSWGNRLKRILGTTVSATGGAVLGGVGARAGSEAAGAIFD